MSTDRELLEAAARAAGLDIVWASDLKCLVHRPYGYNPRVTWNPLTDDGDALRLAVKLRLSIEHHNDVSQPRPWLRIEDRDGRWTHAGPSQEFDDDPYAATRRAIVRAAAAIGAQAEGAQEGG